MELGTDPRIMTQGDLEQTLSLSTPTPLSDARSIVMLQCVGPWDEEESETSFYCSRICCSVAAKNALRIKKQNPQAQIFVLYNRDIRTYGFQEALYTQAREAGVVFLRYQEGSRPQISSERPATDHRTRRCTWTRHCPRA